MEDHSLMTHYCSSIQRIRLGQFVSLFIVSFLFVTQPVTGLSETPHQKISIVLNDFSVHPSISQTTAGTFIFDAANKGINTHELVILRTELKPEALPRKKFKNGRGATTEYLVNEDDARLKTIDEIEEFPAGTRQKKTVFLSSGHYVLFCNIPGHYDKGMYASLHIAE